MKDALAAESAEKQSTQGNDALEEHSQSIVNVLAILSDGKDTMRGPSGTGFFVKNESSELPSCQIATSLHGIIPDSRAPLSSIEVTTADGQKHEAHFAKIDRAHDLALLTVDGIENPEENCKVIDLSKGSPNHGDSVTRLTRSRWGDASSNKGTFDRESPREEIELVPLEGEDPNRKVMVFDLYNNRGVDLGGSPILNESGEVVAVHGGGLDGHTSIAIPVDDLSALLKK